MEKTQIKDELMKYTGKRPFISQTELAKVLHIGKDSARELVNGLAYYVNGKRKDFLIDDVAERIYEKSQSNEEA